MKKVILIIAGILIQISAAHAESLVQACRSVLAFNNQPSTYIRQCTDLAAAKNLSANDIRYSGCESSSYTTGYIPTPDRAMQCLYDLFGDSAQRSEASNVSSGNSSGGEGVDCEITYIPVANGRQVDGSDIEKITVFPEDIKKLTKKIGNSTLRSKVLYLNGEVEFDWVELNSAGKKIMSGMSRQRGGVHLDTRLDLESIEFYLQCGADE